MQLVVLCNHVPRPSSLASQRVQHNSCLTFTRSLTICWLMRKVQRDVSEHVFLFVSMEPAGSNIIASHRY